LTDAEIHLADGVLSFAGLYELWPDPAKDEDDADRWLWSASIITHHATWLAGVMNDRTPVISPRTGSTPGSTRS
jgi:putative SOS response-associated peptidase YedK